MRLRRRGVGPVGVRAGGERQSGPGLTDGEQCGVVAGQDTRSDLHLVVVLAVHPPFRGAVRAADDALERLVERHGRQVPFRTRWRVARQVVHRRTVPEERRVHVDDCLALERADVVVPGSVSSPMTEQPRSNRSASSATRSTSSGATSYTIRS